MHVAMQRVYIECPSAEPDACFSGGHLADELSRIGVTRMGFRVVEEPHALQSVTTGTKRSDIGKRALDIAVASAGLVITSPVILLFSGLVYLQDRGNPFFAQGRYGQNGKVFQCYKIRSMVSDAPERLNQLLESNPAARREWEETQKLRNDPRITMLGRLIRKTSIDELPQLINVLKGDMSIVGPRPIPTYELENYGEDFRFYCMVKPGITGPWQVSGRSNTTYRERVRIDVDYVKSRTFLGDLAIVLKTIPAVLASRGAH